MIIYINAEISNIINITSLLLKLNKPSTRLVHVLKSKLQLFAPSTVFQRNILWKRPAFRDDTGVEERGLESGIHF